MMESTFFYTGVVAFSMMVVGLGFTVYEFRRLGQAQQARLEAEKKMTDFPQGRFEGKDVNVRENARLKVVKAGH